MHGLDERIRSSLGMHPGDQLAVVCPVQRAVILRHGDGDKIVIDRGTRDQRVVQAPADDFPLADALLVHRLPELLLRRNECRHGTNLKHIIVDLQVDGALRLSGCKCRSGSISHHENHENEQKQFGADAGGWCPYPGRADGGRILLHNDQDQCGDYGKSRPDVSRFPAMYRFSMKKAGFLRLFVDIICL